MEPRIRLTLAADDVSLLASVISFASESETYESDDDRLGRLYRRLEDAADRLAAAEI